MMADKRLTKVTPTRIRIRTRSYYRNVKCYLGRITAE